MIKLTTRMAFALCSASALSLLAAAPAAQAQDAAPAGTAAGDQRLSAYADVIERGRRQAQHHAADPFVADQQI